MNFDKEKIKSFITENKSAIGFAIPMTILFLIQDLWFIKAITFSFLLKSIATALACGFLAGFVFNLIKNKLKY